MIKKIRDRGVKTDYVTLHVSAGTFQPIKSLKIKEHPMHNEQILICKANILNLLNAKKVIAVGTTSMRTLESLYWFGTKLIHGNTEFFISKDDPYKLKPVTLRDSLSATVDYLDQRRLERIVGQTEIFIYPGYKFRICNGLITNYHFTGIYSHLIGCSICWGGLEKNLQPSTKKKLIVFLAMVTARYSCHN